LLGLTGVIRFRIHDINMVISLMRQRAPAAAVGIAALWTFLALNAGLEDPACPHHAGHGGVIGHGAPTEHVAHGAGHVGDHGQHAGPTAAGADRGEGGDHDTPCQCSGLCVPGVSVAATGALPRVATAPASTAMVVVLASASTPMLARVPYLIPYPTPPPSSSVL
jgi:hypothetical protein